ncbi:MAG: aminotransferase class I/II-fold pyridoxal phosphate-dependent enzyme [Pyrinomonadaceae bacterium]|nr:aminotransferase class I/II-fold pyridoxal phosphate-dependent enzyme [Phycisphaerales bacterium]
MRDSLAASLAPFGTTIFTTMTKLALQHGAVNLSQGFPDFDGPEFVKDAAIKAMRDGHNQYAPMPGIPALRLAIAQRWNTSSGLIADPDTEVTVTSGCTEAIAAALLGICNPGDEVILFEPFYDSYRASVAMARAVPVFVTLHARADGAPGGARTFAFDPGELRAAFTPRTRAVLVNTPHNPTGKVFSRDELGLIAELCIKHDVIAISDEVYERLTFDERKPHVHLAALPGMAERTITLSSLGKTFSLTGWKIGWAIAPVPLTRAVRAAHQFLTFATSTPLQHGAVAAIDQGEDYIRGLVEQYRKGREFLSSALRDIGFGVFDCEGTYFIMADHTALGFKDDVEFCTHLTTKVGVAAIPPSVFYHNAAYGKSLARFAFCKKMETLERAAERLQVLRRG